MPENEGPKTRETRHSTSSALACNPWMHIGTDFTKDLPESDVATTMLVVVDRLNKMVLLVPIKKDSPTVAAAYLENVWHYQGFPGDVVSNREKTFTGSIFPDLYNYAGNKRSTSTAYHPCTDVQTERIN